MTNQQWIDLSNFLNAWGIIHTLKLSPTPSISVSRDSVARMPLALDPEQANQRLLLLLNRNLVPLGFPRFHYSGKTDDVLFLEPVERTKS